MRWALLITVIAGCAQIFGLEPTQFDQKDAPTDEPSVCDGAPACTSSTGRSVCGQLFEVGAAANQPLRVATPTGAVCAVGNSDGPCVYQLKGTTQAGLFDAALPRVDGEIDDCGRFVVRDLAAQEANVAVVFTNPNLTTIASLVVNRPTTIGEDRGVVALAITREQENQWGNQLKPGGGLDMSKGFLISYRRAGRPIKDMSVTQDQDGAFTNPIGTTPWAAYFTADAPFGTFDPALTATNVSGSAFAVFGTINEFELVGVGGGARCGVPKIKQLGNTIIYVTVDC